MRGGKTVSDYYYYYSRGTSRGVLVIEFSLAGRGWVVSGRRHD
jgi:hypothetical protein